MLVASSGLVEAHTVALVPIAVLVAATVMAASWTCMHSLAFWFGKNQPAVRMLADMTLTFSVYPPILFGPAMKVVLFTVIPAGFVSYGGISGGLRSVQVAKQIVTTLKMMPIPEGVPMPMVFPNLDENGNLKPLDIYRTSAATMLDELHKWAEALRPLRAQRKAPAQAKAA